MTKYYLWQTKVYEGYQPLMKVLEQALDRAQVGKGRERHADGDPFNQQLICWIPRKLGLGFNLGQVIKKVCEIQRLTTYEAQIAELLDCIVYLAAAIIVLQEEEQEKKSEEIRVGDANDIHTSM